MQDDDWLVGDGPVHEGEAAAVGPQAVLEVLPVPEGVDGLVEADLFQEVARRLPGDGTDIEKLWGEPLRQHLSQVVVHLCEELRGGAHLLEAFEEVL